MKRLGLRLLSFGTAMCLGTLCCVANALGASLVGSEWQLTSIAGEAVIASSDARRAYINFGADGKRITGSSGCNRLMGSFTEDGNTLRFSPAALTRIACAAALMKQEKALLEVLKQTSSYRLSGRRLEFLSNGKVLAVLQGNGGKSAVAAAPFDSWLGKWIGPEGTSLILARSGSGYTVRIRSLDGVRTFNGVARHNEIVFSRDGKEQFIRSGNGASTGMKWLLEKKDCLVIRLGEGFCRD